MRLAGVLLDLDGTLLDHRTAVAEALRAWLPTLGVAPTPAVLELWSTVSERHLVGWRQQPVGFQQQRRNRLRDFLPAVGVAVDEDDLDAVFAGYLHRYEDSWRLYDDVDAALADIARAGLPTAVLTNGSTRQQRHKLARTGLAGRLGPVYTAEELGVAKPAAAAYLAACGHWGLPAAAVLHVGDRDDLDVLAARRAGLRAVHLDRDDRGPHDEPARMTSLRELAEVLRAESSRDA